MSCNFTQGFPLQCRDTAGGISTIYIAPFLSKGTVTVVSGSLSGAGSILQSGSAAQFQTVYLHKETGEAKDTYQVLDAAGSIYYEQEVSFPLLKGEVNKTNELKSWSAQSVMIIVKDYAGVSGSYVLLGSDAGLDLSGGWGSGKARKDTNGYSLTFKGMESYPAVYVPSASMAAQLLPA